MFCDRLESQRQQGVSDEAARELLANGLAEHRDGVARLTLRAGLRSLSPQRSVVTTQRQARVRPAPDLVERTEKALMDTPRSKACR